MEFVSGPIKLRDLFLDNGNWWRFFLAHRGLLRKAILINVLKLLVCRTTFLGWHVFVCPTCRRSVKTPHSCKSRFCSSCGKKATDNWIKTAFNTLPHTVWQHITWTLPKPLQPFFWVNRHLFNALPPLAATIIKTLAAQRGFLPGIFLALHTFGRDLKRNVHIHLSTTAGGLSLDHQKWIPHAYFYHDTLKSMWRYAVLSLFRSEFKAGRLQLPRRLRHVKTYTAFNRWLNVLYRKTWVVHLNEQSHNPKATIEYLGKYLKRPPLGESRIQSYNGQSVAFTYLDHYTHTTQTVVLPVLDFLARLIAHIPDRYFRNIRYYGFLAQRVRGQFLPLVYRLLNQFHRTTRTVYHTWRNLLKTCFGRDPLTCPLCGTPLVFARLIGSPPQHVWDSFHQQIAQGYFKRL